MASKNRQIRAMYRAVDADQVCRDTHSPLFIVAGLAGRDWNAELRLATHYANGCATSRR